MHVLFGRIITRNINKQTVSAACSFHSSDLGGRGAKNNCSYFLNGHKQDSVLFSEKTRTR